jgi:hypothetical protein
LGLGNLGGHRIVGKLKWISKEPRQRLVKLVYLATGLNEYFSILPDLFFQYDLFLFLAQTDFFQIRFQLSPQSRDTMRWVWVLR